MSRRVPKLSKVSLSKGSHFLHLKARQAAHSEGEIRDVQKLLALTYVESFMVEGERLWSNFPLRRKFTMKSMLQLFNDAHYLYQP